MGKRSIAVGGLLVLALLVVWLAWRGSGGEDDTAHAATPAAPPAARPSAPAEELEPPAALAPAPAESVRAPDVANAEAGEDERSAASIDAAAAGVRELVLTDSDGAAVAGAEVWIVVGGTEADSKALRDLDRVDAHFRRHGEHHTADAEGRVRLPGGDEALLAVAEGRGLWGSATLDGDGERLAMVLSQDVTLRARVVDEAGGPLVCRMVELRQSFEKRSSQGWSVRRAETAGVEAIATMRHVQRSVSEGFTYTLGVDALVADPVRVAVDLSDPPRDVVTLRLPQHGSVLVEVTDEEGAAPRDRCAVQLSIVGEGEEVEQSPFRSRKRPYVDSSIEDGEAAFPVVELGRRLAVEVRRGGSSIPTRTSALGPVTVGDQVTIPVRLGADHPVARLRAVDGDGAPIAETELAVEVQLVGDMLQQSFQVAALTDDDGWCVVDLERMPTKDSSAMLTVALGSLHEPEAAALVEVDRELQDGLNDLGEVVLSGTPLFVAGRVVDEAGAPLKGVRLKLETRLPGYGSWSRDYDFSHTSDEQGAFEVLGGMPGEAFRLSGEKDGWASRPVEFQRGQRDVVVAMLTEGAIAGRVLLDEGLSSEALDVQVSYPISTGTHRQFRSEPVEVAADGSFRAGGLLPGEFGIEVRLKPGREEVLTVKDLVVRGGETNRDPRLAAIDLRGRVWRHTVRLVPPEDGESLQGQLSFGPAGAESLEHHHWFRENPIDVWSTSERIDLELNTRGYRVERRDSVGAEVEIPLRGGIRVRLVLRGDGKLPEPPIHVKAVLAPEGDSGGALDWGAPAFGEERETVVDVAGPGRMQVHWLVERRSSGSSMATTLRAEEPQTVEVLDLPGEQRVEVELTEELAEQARSMFE